MTQEDAVEISNIAGSMLKQVEERIAWLHGLNYPIEHIDLLPFRDRNFIENIRSCQSQIAKKLEVTP